MSIWSITYYLELSSNFYTPSPGNIKPKYGNSGTSPRSRQPAGQGLSRPRPRAPPSSKIPLKPANAWEKGNLERRHKSASSSKVQSIKRTIDIEVSAGTTVRLGDNDDSETSANFASYTKPNSNEVLIIFAYIGVAFFIIAPIVFIISKTKTRKSQNRNKTDQDEENEKSLTTT